MFPAPTLPAHSRFDGAVMEPVGGHLFAGAVCGSTGKPRIASATSEGMRPHPGFPSGSFVTPGLCAMGGTK